jgi:hypothetical protein
MPGFRFGPEDFDKARQLLQCDGSVGPGDVVVEVLAKALNAERRTHDVDAITVSELLVAHDLLYACRVRSQVPGVLEGLAGALLARGFVPAPGDYGGNWWLWWPTSGRGLCQGCGTERALRRYSARFDKNYRYLCRRCREAENADEEAELNRVTGVIPEPEESADSLLTRRLTALLAQENGSRGLLAAHPEEPTQNG